MDKRTYRSPELQWNSLRVEPMLLNESGTEITDDPATEPALAHGRNELEEEQDMMTADDVWGNLW